MTDYRPLRFVYEGSPALPTKFAEFATTDGILLDMPVRHGKGTLPGPVSGTHETDFDDVPVQYIDLGGNVTGWTTTNRAAATGEVKQVMTIVSAGGGDRTLTFSASWRFQGQKPASIGSGKVGVLTLLSYGTDESNVLAWWSSQE